MEVNLDEKEIRVLIDGINLLQNGHEYCQCEFCTDLRFLSKFLIEKFTKALEEVSSDAISISPLDECRELFDRVGVKYKIYPSKEPKGLFYLDINPKETIRSLIFNKSGKLIKE